MFPIQTNLLFCGLIAGSVPFIFTHVKGKAVKPGMIAAFLVFFLIVIAMALMGETEGAAADVSFSLLNVIKLLVVGIIAAATADPGGERLHDADGAGLLQYDPGKHQ